MNGGFFSRIDFYVRPRTRPRTLSQAPSTTKSNGMWFAFQSPTLTLQLLSLLPRTFPKTDLFERFKSQRRSPAASSLRKNPRSHRTLLGPGPALSLGG